MSVFLDTSVLPRRGRLRTPIIDALLRIASRLELRVCLPEVVLEESVAARHRESETAFQTLLETFNAASKFFSMQPIYIPDSSEAELAWRHELEGSFEIVGLDSSDASASLIREVKRLRPTADGRGARDAAIWLTVVRQHLNSDGTTYFVSSNTADFAEKKGGGLSLELHRDLGTRVDTFKYCASIDDLIALLAERIDLPGVEARVLEFVAADSSDAITTRLADMDSFKGLRMSVSLDADPGDARVLRSYRVDGALIVLIETEATVGGYSTGPAVPIVSTKAKLRIWVEIDEASGDVRGSDVDNVSVEIEQRPDRPSG